MSNQRTLERIADALERQNEHLEHIVNLLVQNDYNKRLQSRYTAIIATCLSLSLSLEQAQEMERVMKTTNEMINDKP